MQEFRISAIVAAFAILGLSACGGSQPETIASAPRVATVTQTSTATPSPPATAPGKIEIDDADVKELMESFGKASTPDAVRESLAFTAPGSPAFVYLTHQANASEAALDGGNPFTDYQTQNLGDLKYESCGDPVDETTCATFANFKINPTGRIVDFTINEKALTGRLTAGSGDKVTSAGNKFTFLTAYKTITGNRLDVAVKVESGPKPINLNLYSAIYRSPDGKQRDATNAQGPLDIGANSNAIVMMTFVGVAPGGTVTLDGCASECRSQIKASIKVG